MLFRSCYRVFVNGELFTERTWIWESEYLEEMLQINASPGQYAIEFKLVDPDSAVLTAKNIRIKQGSARIIDNCVLEIYHEN